MVTSSSAKVKTEIGYDEPAVDVLAAFDAIAHAPRIFVQVPPEFVLPKDAAFDLTNVSTTVFKALSLDIADDLLNPDLLIMLLYLLSRATR
jgi:hypothetical protein